jgi:hypothetical protein
MEGVHHAIACRQVILTARLKSLIRPISVEGATKVGRHFSLNYKVKGLAFHLNGTPGEIQEGVVGGHWFGHEYPLLIYNEYG